MTTAKNENAPSEEEPEYLDDRGLAKRTPITRIAWQKWRARGSGPPYYKVGKRCLYKWAEVQAWLDGLKVAPKPTRKAG